MKSRFLLLVISSVVMLFSQCIMSSGDIVDEYSKYFISVNSCKNINEMSKQKSEGSNVSSDSDEKVKKSNPFSHLEPSQIKEMKYVFDRSPIEAKQIIDHLKDKKFYSDSAYRYAIFVGPPGSGKTTMAKAIGYIMQQEGWDYEYIPSTAILGDKRNESTVRLRSKLMAILAKGRPTFVFIDEMNELLEHTESENYDTSATAKFLWQFLDEQEGNHNFFMIGTMNRDTKLPQPFKSRILAKRIKFIPIEGHREKCAVFREKIAQANIRLASDITDEYINQVMEKLTDLSGRDLREYVFSLKKIFRKYHKNDNEFIINKKIFTEGIDDFIRSRDETQYNRKEETVEERAERHFMQNKILDNLLRECLKTDYRYFGEKINTTSQIMDEECRAAILAIYSDEQRKLAQVFIDRSNKAKEKIRQMAADAEKLEKQRAANQSWWDYFWGNKSIDHSKKESISISVEENFGKNK